MKDGTRNEQRITEWQSSYEEPALRAIAQIAGGSPSPEIRASGIQAASDLSSRLAREKDPARVIAMKRALGSITIGSYEAAGKTRQDKNYSGTSALYEIIVAAQPGNPVALYNAACGFALLGDKKKALRTLEKAIASGFRDVETINRDNDLESLRSDPEFEKLVKTIPR